MKRLATPRVAGDLVNRGAVPTFLQKKTGRRRDQVVMPSFDEALYRGYAGKP
jgi:hypothetical protein